MDNKKIINKEEMRNAIIEIIEHPQDIDRGTNYYFIQEIARSHNWNLSEFGDVFKELIDIEIIEQTNKDEEPIMDIEHKWYKLRKRPCE